MEAKKKSDDLEGSECECTIIDTECSFTDWINKE